MDPVLLIEDDCDLREDLAEILREEGYAVTAVANGREGLERLRERRHALVLLDLRTPVMNGWEFRAAQRADPAICDVPVVIVSGAGDLDRTAERMGVATWLTKPFDVSELLRVVAQIARG